MNKLILLLFASFIVCTSCSGDNNHKELYSIIDEHIDYVISSNEKGEFPRTREASTKDEQYFVSTGVGKYFVVVELGDFPDYYRDEFLYELREHYMEDPRIKDIDINRRGGVTITCRVKQQ